MVPTGDVPVGAVAELDGGAGVVLLLGATATDGDATVVVGEASGGFADPHAVSTAAAVAARQTHPVRTRFHPVIAAPLP